MRAVWATLGSSGSGRIRKGGANAGGVAQKEVEGGGERVGMELIRRYRKERRNILERVRDERKEVRVESAARWAVRYAVCVCSASMLVLNGHLAHHVAHGYGVWAVVTAVNCSERTQGGMLRKSFERALGTIVGCTAAIGVLYVDDFIVPEAYGWNLRASFLYMCVLTFTAATVYLRSTNKRENFDYFYLLATLSFDYLLLSAFADADVNEEPLHRIYMVALGGFLTMLTSIFVFPTYSGDELRSTCATNLDRAATMVEEIGIGAIEVYRGEAKVDEHENSILRQEYKAIMSSAPFEASMINLARFDMRSFGNLGWGREGWSGWRLSVNMPWERYRDLGEGIRSLACACYTIGMLLEKSAANGGLHMEGFDYEVELLSFTRLVSQALLQLASIVSGNSEKSAKDLQIMIVLERGKRLRERAYNAAQSKESGSTNAAFNSSTLMTLLLALEDNLTDIYEAVVELELAGFFDMKPGPFAVLSGPR